MAPSFFSLLTHQFNVCKLQLATTIPHNSVTSLSIMWTLKFATWTQVTQCSDVVVQFSLRSCYGWSHMCTSSSQHHILLWLASLHCRCKHSPKIAQRILKLWSTAQLHEGLMPVQQLCVMTNHAMMIYFNVHTRNMLRYCNVSRGPCWYAACMNCFVIVVVVFVVVVVVVVARLCMCCSQIRDFWHFT